MLIWLGHLDSRLNEACFAKTEIIIMPSLSCAMTHEEYKMTHRSRHAYHVAQKLFQSLAGKYNATSSNDQIALSLRRMLICPRLLLRFNHHYHRHHP